MAVYEIKGSPAESSYSGCGKVWAAINDDQVLALRYMGDAPGDYMTTLPAWVKIVAENCDGLDHHWMPTYHSGATHARLGRLLAACPDTPKPPRRAAFRPAELVKMARNIIADAKSESFGKYRAKCREELAQIGEVVSGECSCYELVVLC